MKTIKIIKYFSGLIVFLPYFAYAVSTDEALGGLAGMVDTFSGTVVKSVGTLFITLAVVTFFWGMVQFIWYKREGNAGNVKVGQSFMAWGLLALFVMFSVWGIISFVGGAVGIKTGGEIQIPYLEFKP